MFGKEKEKQNKTFTGFLIKCFLALFVGYIALAILKALIMSGGIVVIIILITIVACGYRVMKGDLKGAIIVFVVILLVGGMAINFLYSVIRGLGV